MSVGASFETTAYTLTANELSAISDWSALRVTLVATAPVAVSHVVLSAPAANIPQNRPIDVVGEYVTSIDVVGSYVTTIDVVGSYVSEIEVVGWYKQQQ